MGRFSQLFSIEVEHSFFSSGLCRDLVFVPTSKTAMLIRNAGLLVRDMVSGVQVLYESGASESLRLYAADNAEPLKLVFKVYAKDSLFMNYTEPPHYREDAVLYFDSANAVTNNLETSVGGEPVSLHADQYVGDADFQPLGFQGLQKALTPEDQLLRPLSVVNIGISEEVANSLDDGPNGAMPRYRLSFQGRRTVWKYFLLGDFARENLFVADLDNSTEFDFSGTEVLSGERTAVTFKSKVPLPISERSEYRFQLRERGSEPNKILIRRLPAASAAQIGMDHSDGQVIPVSEIYINS